MKKYLRFLTFVLFGFIMNYSWAQDYQARITNFAQVSEYEFQFDIQIRNNRTDPAGLGAWAYNSSQFQLDINTAMLNGGQLQNTYLTVNNSGTNLPSTQQLGNGDFFYSGTNTALATNSPSTATDVEVMLLNDNAWHTISRFIVKLRNAANDGFQNWSEMNPQFTFRFNDVIITEVQYYMDGSIARRGSGPGLPVNAVAVSKVAADLIVDVPEVELSGFVFTGTGNYELADNWNQALKAANLSYIQVVPGATNNAIIEGSATVTDTRTLNQLGIANGAFFVLNDVAKFSCDKLYNDNTGTGSAGVVTIAGWDFENTSQTNFPYSADAGTSTNTGIANFIGVDAGGQLALIDDGGNRVAKGNIYIGGGAQYWQIQLNSSGISDLLLSSSQKNTGSSSDFKVQWSTDGSTFTDVSNGSIAVGTSWTTLNQLSLPSNLNDLTSVFIRWVPVTSNFSNSYIDDIIVEGTAMPSGILIESSATSTGSLIHNSPGVVATIQRYIEGAPIASLTDGLHLLSSAVVNQTIDPAFTTNPIFNYEFFAWNEPTNEWVSYKNTTIAPTWLSVNNNSLNFQPGKGYLAAYNATDTKSFNGYINVADVNISGLTITGASSTNRNWNLLGNPFSCALEWYTGWSTSNIGGVAQVWNEMGKSYHPINPDEIIPSAQGFMVCVTAATGSLTIPEASRVHDNQNFYKSQSYPVITLIAHNLDYPSFQESQVHINPASTTGFDVAFDCDFMPGYAPSFYSVSGLDELCVNSIPIVTEQLVIPFTFIKNDGVNFKIEVEGLSSLQATTYLLDTKTNIDHNLSLNPVYLFTSTAGDSPDRFELHFLNVLVGNEILENNHEINIYMQDQNLHIQTGTFEEREIFLFNITGQLVSQKTTSDFHSIMDLSSLSSGVYVISVQGFTTIFNKKIILNK